MILIWNVFLREAIQESLCHYIVKTPNEQDEDNYAFVADELDTTLEQWAAVAECARDTAVSEVQKSGVSSSTSSASSSTTTSYEPENSGPTQQHHIVPSVCHEVPGPYVIFYKTLTGAANTLRSCERSDTISQIKERIQEKEGIPTDQQLLVCAGQLLMDQNTLAYHGIRENAMLFLAIKLAGEKSQKR